MADWRSPIGTMTMAAHRPMQVYRPIILMERRILSPACEGLSRYPLVEQVLEEIHMDLPPDGALPARLPGF